MDKLMGELFSDELDELFLSELVKGQKWKTLGCSETGAETTGATAIKVPSVKESRTWRSNMSDAYRPCEC